MTLSIINQIPKLFLIPLLLFSCKDPKNQNQNMKHQDEQTEKGLIKAINRLIKPDKNFSLATLDSIYHDDMIVIMIDQNDNKNILKKDEFMTLIASKLEGEERTKNTWAKFIHTEVNQNNGHIVVKRRVNLTEKNNELTVILDFLWEEDHWQITREVIFTHPKN